MAVSLEYPVSTGLGAAISRDFINIFSRRINLFELNFRRNCFPRLSNQAGKIILTAGAFAWCPPVCSSLFFLEGCEGLYLVRVTAEDILTVAIVLQWVTWILRYYCVSVGTNAIVLQ